jgi:hypothetical protein
MRLNFEFPEERINDLKVLQTETGSESMKELINTALTMVEWAVKEVKAGNEIAAVNEDQKVYRVFITPLLERVAKRYAPKPALASGAR